MTKMAERLALKREAVVERLEAVQPVSSTSDASFIGVKAAPLKTRSLAEAAHKASLNAKKRRSSAVEPEAEMRLRMRKVAMVHGK